MAYTSFDDSVPDPSTENGTSAFDSTRENIVAMRDMILFYGFVPGWSAQAQDTGGSAPPTTPAEPDQIVYSSGTERVKVAYTWGTTGGEDGNVTDAVFSYSSNSGSSYDTIGTVAVTYDTNGEYLSHSWS